MNKLKKIQSAIEEFGTDIPDEPNPNEIPDDNGDDLIGYEHISPETAKLAEQETGAKITNESEGNYGLGGMYEFDDGTEWYIFDSYDDAKACAVEQVYEQLKYEPELFNQGWLLSHIDQDSLSKDLWQDEEQYFRERCEEMSDEEILEAMGYDNLEMGEFDDRDAMIDQLLERKEKDFDGVEYLEEIYGDNWMSEFKNIMNYLDERGASQDAVDTDGIAHFLAGYDGNEVDLSNGGVMYRYN